MTVLADPIPQTLTQSIAWVGLRLRVPDSWQVVRHSTDPEKGSMVMVDRRRQRLQLLWTDVPRQPDIEHMVGDHQARELEEDAGARFHRYTGLPAWAGLQRVLDAGSVITRVVRWDERTRRLLEVVILTDPSDPAEATLVEDVLRSIEIACRGRQETRWAMFELDVQTPEGWRLERARVRPADVTFRFAHYDAKDRPTRAEAWVRRRGMADAWYRGDLRKLLRRELPGIAMEFEDQAVQGEPAVLAKSLEPGKRYRRLLGKLRNRRDIVWAWPSANAVYQITTLSKARQPVDVDAFDVHLGHAHDAGSDPEYGADS